MTTPTPDPSLRRASQPPTTRRLWVGTYPDEDAAPGSGEGVWAVELDLAAGRFRSARQAVELASPSFLALSDDERTLYAVTETETGAVSALRVVPGAESPAGDASPRPAAGRDTLQVMATVPTGGSYPCHVVVAPGAVWVANYGSGHLTTVATGGDGSFAGEPETHAGEGAGPDAARQEGPHAHYTVVAPDGAAWVADLGADVVRRYVPQGGGVRPAGTAARVAPGTGPRHVVIAPQGTPGEGFAFLVGELDDQVHVLALGPDDDGALAASVVQSLPARTTPGPAGVGAFPSHVALSPDGTRLYVAVRGPDVVASFAVERTGGGARRGGGPAVTLRHLADSPLVGTWPRHFAVLDTAAGDVLVVAGQTSSTLEALRVRPRSGRAEHLASLALPSPACVVERRILVG